MEEEDFVHLSADEFRERLPVIGAAQIDDASASKAVRHDLADLLRSWTDAEVESVRGAVLAVGQRGRLNEAHPLVRTAGRIWCKHVLAGSTLEGIAHLKNAVARGPTAVVCNHQSYIDSNAIDLILSLRAASDLADRFVSMAGPKVYEGLFRRMASASLNTIPVPQSKSFGHTAKLSSRELARESLKAVAQSHAAMSEGYVVLIYPEGSRTRSGELQPFLPAVYRYFKRPGTLVVPAALTGTSIVMGVGASLVRPAACDLRFGTPINVEDVGGPRNALDLAHNQVARLFGARRLQG